MQPTAKCNYIVAIKGRCICVYKIYIIVLKMVHHTVLSHTQVGNKSTSFCIKIWCQHDLQYGPSVYHADRKNNDLRTGICFQVNTVWNCLQHSLPVIYKFLQLRTRTCALPKVNNHAFDTLETTWTKTSSSIICLWFNQGIIVWNVPFFMKFKHNYTCLKSLTHESQVLRLRHDVL